MKNTETSGPRRYLVTGGFGYAGSWISEYLASQGHRVFVLSRRTDAPGISWPCTLISADVEKLSPEGLAPLLPESLDGIVHAASLNEEFLPDYPRRALLVNGLGTRNLIAALLLKQEQQGLPLLIYCSTIHVYGAVSGAISEATPPQPRSDYALTHYIAEEYCRLFMRTRNIPCVIIRLSNGYGAPKLPHSDNWHLLLNELCKTAVRDGQIVLRSHPDTPRDFIWLGDVAKSIHTLLERPDLAGRLFNLSGGQCASIGAVARRVAALAEKRLGRSVPLRFENACAAPLPDLHISNAAFIAATGLNFDDRMEEEIAGLLASLGA
jgi:UDP-glucose 4-epimerase